MSNSQQSEPRKYEKIWAMIKANTSDKPVIVKVKAGPFQKTLIQAVKKEKTKENAPRKQVGATYHGELIIDRYDDRVEFKLRYNGDHI